MLALFFGSTVSLQASGRLSARLVADGIVSFAFIPIFEILSLAVVYRRGPRRVPFAQAVDLFFVGNTPWLLWLLAFAAVRSLLTPLQATAFPDWWVLTLLLSLIPTASWSAYIDLQFFRTVLPRQEGSAARDLILQRAISWTCILGWYWVMSSGSTWPYGSAYDIATLGAVALLVTAIVAGTVADRPPDRPPLILGGYRVLAADFHTHSSIWSDGTLTPWGLVLEADHQGLDAIAITGHDQTIGAHIGHWYTRTFGGPTILVGDEVLGDNGFHITAAGITDTVRYRRSGGTAIDDIHRQGGIAIVAHPFSDFWPGYDPRVLRGLDGAEICHPAIYALQNGQRELEQFAARAPVAAIGSSDFHGSA